MLFSDNKNVQQYAQSQNQKNQKKQENRWKYNLNRQMFMKQYLHQNPLEKQMLQDRFGKPNKRYPSLKQSLQQKEAQRQHQINEEKLQQFKKQIQAKQAIQVQKTQVLLFQANLKYIRSHKILFALGISLDLFSALFFYAIFFKPLTLITQSYFVLIFSSNLYFKYKKRQTLKNSTYSLKYLKKEDVIELIRINNQRKLIKPQNIKMLNDNKDSKVLYYDKESGAKFQTVGVGDWVDDQLFISLITRDSERGLHDKKVVIPGQFISLSSEFMTGTGTYEQDGKIYSSLAGTVKQTSRLLTIIPFNRKFIPQVGDVVIGRVIAIQQSRWKLQIGAAQFGNLALTAAQLPSGQQRRRLQEDKLKMREIFTENDLIVAQVHSVNPIDGRVNLQTRNIKFGKLVNGLLIQVKPTLIERMKSHFITLQDAICAIVGMNGWIWIYFNPQQVVAKSSVDSGFDFKQTAAMQLENLYQSSKVHQIEKIPPDVRRKIAEYKGKIKYFNQVGRLIGLDSLKADE